MSSIDTVLMTGKPVATALYERLKPRIEVLGQKGITPGLVALLVGDDPASAIYVGSKTRKFEELGLLAETRTLPGDISRDDLLAVIAELNAADRFHGLLVQLPLPNHLPANDLLESVAPAKDIDGFHPFNLGRLLAGNPTFIPCTPQGILELLSHYGITVAGRHAVIVGRSNIVGKPLAALLSAKQPSGNATVTLCHTGTANLAHHTRQADLLIVASGQAGLVTPDMVTPGVVIVDVGINRTGDDSPKGYHLRGDVDTEKMLGIAQAITPVPGGVGPLTVAMLVSNTVLAAERSAGVVHN